MRERHHFTECAKVLKALADPERLRIVEALQVGAKSVSELAEALGQEVPNISHHLGVLRHSGLLVDQKRGKFVFYSLHPELFPEPTPGGRREVLELGYCRLDFRPAAGEAPRPALSAEQLAQYDRDGYLILRGVFDADEIAALAAEAEMLAGRKELIDPQNLRCRWQENSDTGAHVFDCFDPVVDIGPVARYIAHDARLLDPLRAIYGDEPHLFKDKLFFKPPGAKGYALHQDYIAWEQFPRSFVAAIVAIDPADAENGAIEVFPGAQRQGVLSPADGDYHELPLEAVDRATGVLLELLPGDVALFGAFMPHRSGPNRSGRWRRQLYLSYNAQHDGGEQRAAHYQQFHAWLAEKYALYGRSDVYFR